MTLAKAQRSQRVNENGMGMMPGCVLNSGGGMMARLSVLHKGDR